jgi:hypothetical protein
MLMAMSSQSVTSSILGLPQAFLVLPQAFQALPQAIPSFASGIPCMRQAVHICLRELLKKKVRSSHVFLDDAGNGGHLRRRPCCCAMCVALVVAVVWSVATTRALEQAPGERSKGAKGTERWRRAMQSMLDSAVSSWAWVW